MILEGIVTTVSAQGAVNIAPMGPYVDNAMDRFLLRPFATSQTCRNLMARGEGVLHVTDDVLLLAQAALGPVAPTPSLVPATNVQGFVLSDACRFYEFRVRTIDATRPRVEIHVEVVHHGRLRDFFGFNRAKHAVVEAAILATRTAFLPLNEVDAEFQKLEVIVAKTGGPQEHAAFQLLRNHLRRAGAAPPGGSAVNGTEQLAESHAIAPGTSEFPAN
jgi:uncharacterized protein